jgi:hypothetical protein
MIAKKMAAAKQQNNKQFQNTFPDQARYYLESKTEVQPARRDPDAFFMTLFFNVILLSVTVASIYKQHDYSTEFWSRQSILSIFNEPDLPIPYFEVINYERF